MFELNIQFVLLVVAVAWHYVLFCGFVSDDHAVIENRKDIIPDSEKIDRREKKLVKIFNDGVIMYFANRTLWRLFGKWPAGWHLFSYLIHLLNTFLFYRVLAGITTEPIALSAALLWGVNPMLNQVAGWCSGRPYGISASLALTALLFWDKPGIVLPCYSLGVITNMSVALLPFIIKAIHGPTWQTSLYFWYIVGMTPFILWKFTRRFAQNALALDRENFHFRYKRFNCLARLLAYYTASLLFPVKMGWYHEAGFRYNKKWDGFNIWALAGYALAFWLCWAKWPQGSWYLLALLPNMNLFATNSFIQDRYVYFASMGLAWLGAEYLALYPMVIIAIAAIYASKTYGYTRHMVDDEHLYRENWRNHPASDYALNNLGFFTIQKRQYDEARCYTLRGLAIDRENRLLWYNLGITWAAKGHLGNDEGRLNFMRAIDCWKMCLQIEPRWAKPAEDMNKLIQYLVNNKVLTLQPQEAASKTPVITAPNMEGTA